MKKLVSYLLITVLILSFTSCKRIDTPDEPVNKITTETQDENQDSTVTPVPENTKKEIETDTPDNTTTQTIPDDNQSTSLEQEKTEDKQQIFVLPDSLTETDRQTLKAIAESKKPYATVTNRPDEHSGCSFHYQAKAKELIDLLASFEYIEGVCQCGADNVIYIGESNEFKFYLKRHVDNEIYESVEYGGASHQLTEQEGEKLTRLVESIIDEKNYKSIKGLENSVEFIERKGDEFIWYSFKNADSERLIYLTYNIEKNEPIMTEDIDSRFINTISMRFALNCDKPYITDSEGSAYLSKKQLKEIKAILKRNCIEANIKDNPDSTMPVHIQDLAQNKEYKFTNEASPFLINYIVFYSYLDRNVSCNCKEEYSIYSHFYIYMQKKKEIVNQKYSIGFVDGIAHLTQYGEYHLVLSEKDSRYIKEIIDKNCTEQNLVK